MKPGLWASARRSSVTSLSDRGSLGGTRAFFRDVPLDLDLEPRLRPRIPRVLSTYFAAIKSGSSTVTFRDRVGFFGLDSTTTGLTLARSSIGFKY